MCERDSQSQSINCLSHAPNLRPGLQARHVPLKGKTGNLSVCRQVLNPLSHTGQGKHNNFQCNLIHNSKKLGKAKIKEKGADKLCIRTIGDFKDIHDEAPGQSTPAE